jgi:hypothetical protein
MFCETPRLRCISAKPQDHLTWGHYTPIVTTSGQAVLPVDAVWSVDTHCHALS